MSDTSLTADLLRKHAGKRSDRRRFMRNAGGLCAGLVGGTILGACGGDDDDANAQTDPGPTDAEILNFALNLEYLEAQFYLAAIGQQLPAGQLAGVGAQGMVAGGRQVMFTDPIVRQYALEIAADERAHVLFLRSALGSAAVAQPALDIGPAFAAAAAAAGLGSGFDAYASDENFLLAAYIFEDVGVTAYKGASPLIDSPVFLEAAAGILAAEAYHAGLVRTVLYAKGVAMPSLMLHEATLAISDLRDGADDTSTDQDQGVVRVGNSGNIVTDPMDGTPIGNIVPLDANGLAFSRSPGDVLNIVYLTPDQATMGGFFPNGVNGALNMSSAMA